MKLTAFILASYILLLTVQPVAVQVYLSVTHHTQTCHMACCKHKQGENTKHDANNCCDKGICNPFGMCNCCFVYNESATTVGYDKLAINNKFIAKDDNNLVSSYLSDCFHPPEIS